MAEGVAILKLPLERRMLWREAGVDESLEASRCLRESLEASFVVVYTL